MRTRCPYCRLLAVGRVVVVLEGCAPVLECAGCGSLLPLGRRALQAVVAGIGRRLLEFGTQEIRKERKAA